MNRSNKRIYDCPFCEVEKERYSTGWGFTREGWRLMREKHKAHKLQQAINKD